MCGIAGQASKWLEERAAWALGVGAVVIGVAIAAIVNPTRAATGATAAGTALATGRPWPLLVAVGIAFIALLLALAAAPEQRRLAWAAAACGLLALAGLASEQQLIRLVLLEAAAFGTVGLLFASDAEPSARLAYLSATLISAACLAAGTLLLPSGPTNLVLALFLVGFAVKFALVPLYVWLPRMAQLTPAALAGLVVAIIDAAAFGELFALRFEAPWTFSETWPWVALGLLSALGGAGLMLAARDLKRMLALFATVSAGFVVLGATFAGDFGAPGAMALAVADTLALALAFTSLAAAETRAPVTLAARGLAGAHPLASAGFLLGSLAALGLPLTAGWPGHWRVYAAASASSHWLLGALVVATILSMLAFARAIALVWWGEPTGSPPTPAPLTSEDWLSGLAITLAMLAIVAIGLFPQLLAVLR